MLLVFLLYTYRKAYFMETNDIFLLIISYLKDYVKIRKLKVKLY